MSPGLQRLPDWKNGKYGKNGKNGGKNGKYGGKNGKNGGKNGKYGKNGGKNGKYGGKNGKYGGKNGKNGGATLDVPASVAVSDVAKPIRLAGTETVAEVLYANPAWVTVPPLRDTLPAVVVML
jgi:hypothetical protein